MRLQVQILSSRPCRMFRHLTSHLLATNGSVTNAIKDYIFWIKTSEVRFLNSSAEELAGAWKTSFIFSLLQFRGWCLMASIRGLEPCGASSSLASLTKDRVWCGIIWGIGYPFRRNSGALSIWWTLSFGNDRALWKLKSSVRIRLFTPWRMPEWVYILTDN